MFDRTERGFFEGNDVARVMGPLSRALEREAIPLQQTAAAAWVARGTQISWGMVQRVALTVLPTPQGFMLEVRVSADIQPGTVVPLVFMWLFCFPAALFVAFLAYQDFTRKQAEVLDRMREAVEPLMIPANFPAPFAGAPPQR
ncbi:MAG: hypothetical protein WKG00_40495 [Polyangiaceae bacterium]